MDGNGSAFAGTEMSTAPRPSEVTALGHDKRELVRLLVQAMDSLGYSGSARALERESGTIAICPAMRCLRQCILDGEWSEVERVFDKASNSFRTESDSAAARFVVYEQQFLELLDVGKTSEALHCLRNHVAPHCPRPELLHKLPLLCMCSSPDEVRRRANWTGTGIQSRSAVLRKLQKFIPPDVLLQEDRLESLVQQAIDVQKRLAMFPYTKQNRVSLLENLEHSPVRVPRSEICRLRGHADEVWFVQFSHSGRYLASASKDTSVIIWDWAGLRDGTVKEEDAIRHRLKGHSQDICLLSWSPDDTHLLSCGKDCSIRLWNAESGIFVRAFSKHTEQVTACSWMPHGRSFVSGSVDRHICEWDALSGVCIGQYTPSTRVQDLSVSNDGKKLVAICTDNVIQVFDSETKALLTQMSEAVRITSMSLSLDARTLLVNTLGNVVELPEIHIWDLEQKRICKRFKGFKQERYVIRACFGGFDQMLVICGSEDNLVYMWERHSGEVLARLEGHSATVNSVAWCPSDPNVFASGSDDKTVIVWGVRGDED
jgi:WD repeat-containing protein 26